MDISIPQPVQAQRLDDEGDPIGEVVTLPAGSYRLMSRLYVMPDDPEGTARMWIEDKRGDVYEARGMATNPS